MFMAGKRWPSDGLHFFRDIQSSRIMSVRKLENGGGLDCFVRHVRESIKTQPLSTRSCAVT